MAGRIEFRVQNATFYIRKYEPFLALKILGDLQRRFLGPVAMIWSSIDETQSEEAKTKAIVEGVQQISASVDGAVLVMLTKMILNEDYISVVIGAEPAEKLNEGNLNRAIDNVGEIFELIAKVLQVNYQEVFTRATTHIGKDQLNMVSQLVN